VAQWTYRGVAVKVPRTADIPHRYKQGGRAGYIVQEVLDGVEPWEPGSDPIETIVDLEEAVPEIIVPIDGKEVIWAKHAYHSAKIVQLSPFVRTLPVMTRSFTVVLAKTPENPMVTRAFPGEYAPPLPWQRFRMGNELEESREFWSTHAYVYDAGLIVPGSIVTEAPAWFTD